MSTVKLNGPELLIDRRTGALFVFPKFMISQVQDCVFLDSYMSLQIAFRRKIIREKEWKHLGNL